MTERNRLEDPRPGDVWLMWDSDFPQLGEKIEVLPLADAATLKKRVSSMYTVGYRPAVVIHRDLAHEIACALAEANDITGDAPSPDLDLFQARLDSNEVSR
jgi:hypothetical protein